MKFDILGHEAFPMLRVELKKGEEIKAESNAMVAMSGDIELKGTIDGGVVKGLFRKFSGESFFMQNFKAQNDNDWVMLAGKVPGVVMPIELTLNKPLLVQKGSYLAAEKSVDISTKMQSLGRGFFSGEGFFVVRLSGAGKGFLSVYGGSYLLELKAGEKVKIDNGHLVAWDADMKYKLGTSAKGWVSALTSGEILATEFTGPGRVWIQSRNLQDFVQWLIPHLPRPPRRTD
jgi:uncharacterized protein (TIGR00266 family)